MDRGFRAGEPVMLILMSSDPDAAGLTDRANAGGRFSVTAYNNNQGAMVVTSIALPPDGDGAETSPGDTGGQGGSVDDLGPETGSPTCFAGHTIHTGGPRKGKVFNTTLCIDWSARACAMAGENIMSQSVTECTPGRAIKAMVRYGNGKSVLWDMQVDEDSGKLVGRWTQSDGARGKWVTH
jgi:hypothetical protein